MLENDLFGSPHISAEMRLNYLARRKDEILQCRSALSDGRWEVLKRAGHRIKGNAETFGLTHLGPLGAALEVCAEKQQASEATKLLDQLSSVVSEALLESTVGSTT